MTAKMKIASGITLLVLAFVLFLYCLIINPLFIIKYPIESIFEQMNFDNYLNEFVFIALMVISGSYLLLESKFKKNTNVENTSNLLFPNLLRSILTILGILTFISFLFSAPDLLQTLSMPTSYGFDIIGKAISFSIVAVQLLLSVILLSLACIIDLLSKIYIKNQVL